MAEKPEPDDASRIGDVRRERDAALDAQERFAFLARTGKMLARSIDYEQTLKTVASLALPYLGAWCIVDVLEDGDLRRLAVIHPKPGKQAAARRLCELYPERTAEALGVYRVLESGEPEVVTRIDSEQIDAMVLEEEQRRLFEEVGIGGYMTVPLAGRDQVHGTMTFVTRESGRRIGHPDLLMAEDLAYRAGLAFDNARLYKRSEEANRAKADFLAVISHELRTPLTAILGYADLLIMGVDGPVNEEQEGRLKRIHHSARHMVQLVKELISYAQVEAGGEAHLSDDVDVREVLERALEAVREEAEQKGLEVGLEVQGDARVRTDPRMLRQIVVNLLTNAVKFTEEGRVTVRTRRGEDSFEIDVEDTGRGIPEAEREKIFDPFWQGEAPNTRTYGGTGIGLSLTRRLIAALDAVLELDSTYGVGTCFTVRLPLSPTP
ncbi:MAG: sensor histidine kinase [Gemmatimonadota bacterium]